MTIITILELILLNELELHCLCFCLSLKLRLELRPVYVEHQAVCRDYN